MGLLDMIDLLLWQVPQICYQAGNYVHAWADLILGLSEICIISSAFLGWIICLSALFGGYEIFAGILVKRLCDMRLW